MLPNSGNDLSSHTNFVRYLVNVTESIRGVSVGPQMDTADVQAFLRLAC